MASIRLDVHPVAYRELQAHADFGFYRTLEDLGDLALMDRSAPPAGSDSPWMDRAALAARIGAGNPHLPPPPAETRFVIGGQQAGLLTGPLYTFLKAVTAIRMARDLSQRTGAPFAPLFWIASEDHDIHEVNRVVIAGERFVHEYRGDLTHGRVPPVGEISLREAREPLLRFLAERLPPTEFTPWVLEIVAAADFATYATAFRDWMRALLGEAGLRLVDPAELRRWTSPILAELAARWHEVDRALAAGGRPLQALGLEIPLETPRIFELSPAGRRRVEIDGDRARLSDRTLPLAELPAWIGVHPEAFSPGAALRAVCQDAIIPTQVTLGGPAELAYLFQILPIYDVIQVRPSARAPRISATFLGPAIRHAAQKSGLDPEQVFSAVELAADPAQPTDASGAATDSPQARAIRDRGAALLEAVDAVAAREPSPRWLRKGRAAIAAALERILGELAREQHSAEELARRRYAKIAETVLPGGRPQERQMCVIELLNLYGPEFVQRACELLDPWERRHQIVEIVPAKGESQR